jgi:alpha-tubulin suppressor-like RCC1 family protein
LQLGPVGQFSYCLSCSFMPTLYVLLLSSLLTLAELLAPGRVAAQALHGTFAGGQSHSLSIHADGSLWATGSNAYGQLGQPASTASTTAWVPVGPDKDWVQVAAGYDYSLGLKANGTLWAWGHNNHGQLGSSTNSNTDTPTPTMQQVGTPTDRYTQIAAGDMHGFGLRADGSLWAWGDNYFGQLGNSSTSGTSAANPTPLRVGAPTDRYTQVAAGGYHGFGLKADGTLWAWGINTSGQLGNPTNSGAATANHTPLPVGAPTDRYTQVASGSVHGLGLRADGTLWAWGNNQAGQLGTTANSRPIDATPTPQRVGAATDTYTQLAAGSLHSLGLRADGTLWAWGNNQYGQLGNAANSGVYAINATPVPVGSPTDRYAQVAASGNHSLGLRADGSLWAWGNNEAGQLGTATSSSPDNPTPTATGTALPTRSTAAGAYFGLAVKADGTLWAWGYNNYGQLGTDATATPSATKPQQVGTDRDWVMVAAGDSHGLALKVDGTLWAWGYNGSGQLATARNSGTITPNPTLTRVGDASDLYRQVAAGQAHSLALRADGSLWAWGQNSYGQLGNASGSGFTGPHPTPGRVGTATDLYTQVAAGNYHSLALKVDGSLWAWGYNYFGQLGNGTSSNGDNPTPMRAGATTDLFIRTAAGNSCTLGLKADGSLWAWGSNEYGQLGNPTSKGNLIANPTPLRVGATTDLYTQMGAGTVHGMGLRADGSLWAWGLTQYGQLGVGFYTNTVNTTPTQEATGRTDWATLAVGPAGYTSLARTASGLNFASTGYNNRGQLGDGTTTNANRFSRLSPLTDFQPLPVVLTRFSARRAGPALVQLAWATASEQGNAGFGIERAADGVQFQRLAFVAGAGSSLAAHAYAYPDPSPTAAYYRLAQTDAAGTVNYSPVQYVAGAEDLAPAALLLVPNPAHGLVQALGQPAGTPLTLYNGLGQLVRPATTRLDVAGLPAGIYVVRAGSLAARLVVE